MTTSRWAHVKLSPEWQHRVDLLRGLVARDLKVRYKGSFLGIAVSLALGPQPAGAPDRRAPRDSAAR